MINVLSVKQVKHAEAVTIADGVSEDELIERAALRVFKHIDQLAEKGAKIAVLAGGGNNGADGLSFAVLALEAGYGVTVYLMTEKRNENVQSRIDRLAEAGEGCIEVTHSADIDYGADIFVDAVIGTGCDREVTGVLADVIKHINNLHKTVVSVDIPTGLNANTGYIKGEAFNAAHTVTFGFFKLGQIINDGRACCGRLTLYNIGLSSDEYTARIIDDESVKMPARPTVSHKGDYGRVKIIAGCASMVGGAILAHEGALAALRSGAGYSTLCVPASLAIAYQAHAAEETLQFMPDIGGSILYDESVLDELADNATAVVVGMGMGNNPAIIKIIKYLARKDITLVVDADGLNALAADLTAVAKHKCRLILTPHAGEFKRLSSGRRFASAVSAVKTMAAELDAVVVMKSATTIISDGKEVLLNVTGSPAMAKAGSGDVLSGMLGALACNFKPLDAAARACYYFGKAGEHAAREKGEWSVLASDIILKL